jgi:hypothetical protein
MWMPYSIDLRSIQAPLKESYRSDPATALVTTSARSVPSDLSDPRHCAVVPVEHSQVVIRSGLHPAAGGAGDTPCSGDILAAALAICEESTLRSVAANMGIELEAVEVQVDIDWDFRGTMGTDREVPVAQPGSECELASSSRRGLTMSGRVVCWVVRSDTAQPCRRCATEST